MLEFGETFPGTQSSPRLGRLTDTTSTKLKVRRIERGFQSPPIAVSFGFELRTERGWGCSPDHFQNRGHSDAPIFFGKILRLSRCGDLERRQLALSKKRDNRHAFPYPRVLLRSLCVYRSYSTRNKSKRCS